MSNPPIPPAIAQIAPDGMLTPRQKRRLLIEMSLRKQKPGTGSSLEFLQRRTAVNPWPDLREVLADLQWVVVGMVAARTFMPERMTNELDILVYEADYHRAVHQLQRAGFTAVTCQPLYGKRFCSPQRELVDILPGAFPWLDEALPYTCFDPAGLPVLGLPYFVLMQLAAPRIRDWTYLSLILGLADDGQLAQVRQVVARYSPIDSEDLESLIYLGKMELQPPTN
jgi:hypothetical protein